MFKFKFFFTILISLCLFLLIPLLNIQAVSLNLCLQADETAPVIQVVSPQKQNIYWQRQSLILEYSLQDASDISLEQAELWLQNGQQALQELENQETISFQELEPGDYYIKIQASDEYGNQSEQVINFQIKTDLNSLKSLTAKPLLIEFTNLNQALLYIDHHRAERQQKISQLLNQTRLNSRQKLLKQVLEKQETLKEKTEKSFFRDLKKKIIKQKKLALKQNKQQALNLLQKSIAYLLNN